MKRNSRWRRHKARAKTRRFMHLYLEVASVLFKAGQFATRPHLPHWAKPHEAIGGVAGMMRPIWFGPDNTAKIARSHDRGMRNADLRSHTSTFDCIEEGKPLPMPTTPREAQNEKARLKKAQAHQNTCIQRPFRAHKHNSLVCTPTSHP